MHKLSDTLLNISPNLPKEKVDKKINQNNKLFQEVNKETSIINKKSYNFFDKPIYNYIEKYFSAPPIFKRFGKYYNEKRKVDEEVMKKRIIFDFHNEIRSVLGERTKKFLVEGKMKTDIKESEVDENLNALLETLLLDTIMIFYQNNKDIQKEKKLDCIFETKIQDLYEEYINSEQFQKIIKKLSKEEKSYEYIYNYINTSKDLVNCFKSTDNKEK